jgi:glycosyltransferase involved in cell wall biosynthesis
MKILHLESSRSWGGQEYRTCLEINWLNAHGHDAWLICDCNSEVLPKARELGTRVVAMPLRRRFDPLISWRLRRFCRRNRVDLVKAYSSKDHWLALPLYFSGVPLTRVRSITDRIGTKARSFIFKHGCSAIVVVADAIKRQLVGKNGVEPGKIHVIGSAVDLHKFHPARDRMKFRRELGLDSETPLIANIGMIRPDKGQLVFVEAARVVLAQRPNARFAIVGQGTGRRKRGEKVRDAIIRTGIGDRLFLLGYRWDTPDIFAAADIMAITSLHTEASPVVLREAFASGRAVVATKVGDVPEIIEHRQNGLLVEPSDSDGLAAAILELLAHRDLLERCAANAWRYAQEHFSFDSMMRSTLTVDATTAGVDLEPSVTRPADAASRARNGSVRLLSP